MEANFTPKSDKNKDSPPILSSDETPVTRGNKSTVDVIIVVVLLCLVVIGAVYFYFTSRKPEPAVSPTITQSISPTKVQPTPIVTNTRISPTPTPTVGVKKETYTSLSLPGFSIQYLPTWEVEVKEFSDTDSKGFISGYRPNCEQECMGVRFNKTNVSLELVFNVEGLSDQVGFRCSNSVEHTLVEEPWYRLKGTTQHYYSKDIKLGVDIGSDGNFMPGFFGSSSDEWNIMPNTHYELCDYNSQNYLVEDPIRYKNGGLAYRIYLKNPEIKGDPSGSLLEELDQMVLSINGIKD